MHLNKLTFTNFRNLNKDSLTFSPRYNFFLGANAQGKTNLLEAIYYLAFGRSFRTSRIANLINTHAEFFYLKGESLRNDKLTDLLEVSYQAGLGRRHKHNGQILKRGEYPWGVIPTLSYNRKDLRLTEEDALNRRRFLDQEISYISKTYFLHLKRYNRCLKQRNVALKRGGREDNVRLWDSELASEGANLILKRREFVNSLNVLARLTYRQLTASGEELSIVYQSDFSQNDLPGVKEAIVKQLEQKLRKEQKLGYTTAGPHRDDLDIKINNLNIRSFGSSGQHKSVVLSIKLALIEIVKKEVGCSPVFLLDDVFSELDESRSQRLMEILRKKKLQVFISGNHLPPFLKSVFQENTSFFKVVTGKAEQVNIKDIWGTPFL